MMQNGEKAFNKINAIVFICVSHFVTSTPPRTEKKIDYFVLASWSLEYMYKHFDIDDFVVNSCFPYR